jgi:hypothetical protein
MNLMPSWATKTHTLTQETAATTTPSPPKKPTSLVRLKLVYAYYTLYNFILCKLGFNKSDQGCH